MHAKQFETQEQAQSSVDAILPEMGAGWLPDVVFLEGFGWMGAARSAATVDGIDCGFFVSECDEGGYYAWIASPGPRSMLHASEWSTSPGMAATLAFNEAKQRATPPTKGDIE